MTDRRRRRRGRKEFRDHKSAKPEFVTMFMRGWESYANDLEKSEPNKVSRKRDGERKDKNSQDVVIKDWQRFGERYARGHERRAAEKFGPTSKRSNGLQPF